MQQYLFVPLVLFALCVGGVWLSLHMEQRERPHRVKKQAEAQQIALECNPLYQQKIAAERAHELALNQQRLKERELDLKETQIPVSQYGLLLPQHQANSMTFIPPWQRLTQGEQGKQEEGVVESTLAYEQPSLEALLTQLPYNGLQLPYGRNLATGELLTSTLIDAVHILLIGDIGMGKSTQASGILTALCARNDPQHLQLALVDHEGITSEPFVGLPHTRYLAESPEQAARNLGQLVRELERRQDRKLLVKPGIDPRALAFPVLLLFLEEFVTLKNALKGRLRDQALEDFTRLSLQGRKFGMFLLCIGQTGYMDRDIRDAQRQFQSKMALGIHPKAAYAAGFTDTQLLNQNNTPRVKGRFVLEGTQGHALVMAPRLDYDEIPRLLGPSQELQSTFVDASDSPSAFNEERDVRTFVKSDESIPSADLPPTEKIRSRRVVERILQGDEHPAIIKDEWNLKATSGAKYQEAKREFEQIIRELAVNQRGA